MKDKEIVFVDSLISSAPQIKTEIVDVPELGKGAQIIISEMSGEMSTAFNNAVVEMEKAGDERFIIFMCSLICACAVNQKGERIMKISDAEYIAKTYKWDFIVRLYDVAADLNGYSPKLHAQSKKS